MATYKLHLRHCVLWEFQRTKCYRRVPKFSKSFWWRYSFGDSCAGDSLKSLTIDFNDDIVKTLIEKDPFSTILKISEKLNISDHIPKLGLVYKYSRWMPQKLSEKNLYDRIVIYTSLLARTKNEPVLDRMMKSRLLTKTS